MATLSSYDGISSDDIDPCTGFPTTHKAKLSIPQILWTRTSGGGGGGGGGGGSGRNSLSSDSSPAPPPLNPIDNEIQNRVSTLLRDQKGERRRRKRKSAWIGLVFTLLSAITFSFNALLAKLLRHWHPFNLGVWTFLVMTVISGIWIIYQVKIKKDDEKEICTVDLISSLKGTGSTNRKLYVYFFLRAFCGVSALILFFYSVKYLPVADALVIDASSPIFVYLMAYLFLGEKLGLLPVFTTLLAFSGVALIARPPILLSASSSSSSENYDSSSLIGATLSFFSMLCITTTIISLKFLETVHHSIINFTFGLWGTLQCLMIAGFCDALALPTELDDILKILGVAFLFFLGQAFITVALQYQDAGPVGLVRTTEVVFIFVWQFVFLGVVPDVYSWCGALLILLGVGLTLLRNWISELTAESKLRNNCKLLLY